MGSLVTFQEIITSYEGGENAFDLTLEKWARIRESLKNAFTMTHYREILGAAVIKDPFWKTRAVVPYAPYKPFLAEGGRVIGENHAGDSGLPHCWGSPSKIPVARVGPSNHFGVGVL